MYWRCDAPAEVIGGRVAKVVEKDVERAFLSPNTDTGLSWRMHATQTDGTTRIIETKDAWDDYTHEAPKVERVEAVFPQHEGAAIFIRPDIARATLAKAMRLQGIRTVAETDDNYFADKRYNIFARTQGTGELIHEWHAKAMGSMEANVFSTEWLRDRYFREFRKRFGAHGLPESFVCRNSIPVDQWPVIEDYDGPLRVGFMGSTSHLWDLPLAYGAFHAAKHVGCTTTMIGFNPADPDPDVPDEIEVDGKVMPLRSRKSMAVSAKWAKVIDTHIRWVDPGEYHRTPLPLDIGLAPLRTNDFTLGKSDVKAIEFSISGAACVLMKHPIYMSGGWKHGENCLLAKNREDMGLQTLRLIRDPGLRRELVTAARSMIREERNEHTIRKEWMAAING